MASHGRGSDSGTGEIEDELRPQIGDLLTLQGEHRSLFLKHRSLFLRHSENYKLADNVRKVDMFKEDVDIPPRCRERIEAVGLWAVMTCCRVRIDRGLITVFVERWRQETHTFHLPIGEVTVTLQDVAILFGLRIDGQPVTGMQPRYEDRVGGWQNVCTMLLGWTPVPSDFSCQRIRRTKLVAWIKANPLLDDASNLQVEQRARALMFFHVTALCCDKCSDRAPLAYLSLLEDLEVASTYSWGNAVLACLYRNLYDAILPAKKHEISGPLHLLQFWIWERFPAFRPDIPTVGVRVPRPPVVEPGTPRATWWLNVRSFQSVSRHVVDVVRDQLDNMAEGDFIWTSYSDEIIASLPSICRDRFELLRARVPLILWEIVELHCPDRVLRQFGLAQVVPDPVDTGVELHHAERRTAGTDYHTRLGQYIQQWDGRYGSLAYGVPSTGPMAADSPYMQWYRPRTLLTLGRRRVLRIGDGGYRGHSADMLRMADTIGRMIYAYQAGDASTAIRIGTDRLRSEGLGYILDVPSTDTDTQFSVDGHYEFINTEIPTQTSTHLFGGTVFRTPVVSDRHPFGDPVSPSFFVDLNIPAETASDRELYTALEGLVGSAPSHTGVDMSPPSHTQLDMLGPSHTQSQPVRMPTPLLPRPERQRRRKACGTGSHLLRPHRR